MARTIGAVVVGYLVMFAFVFVSFTLAYLAMGTDGAFQAQSYDVSGLWIAASIVLGFVAAIVGGLVAVIIAKNSRGPTVLAAAVLILGVLMAIPALTATDEGEAPVRTEELGSMEAMQHAKQPTWMALFNPVLGAVGVLLGGKLKNTSNP